MDGALILLGVFAVLGYLIGSVNFAVLVAKKYGVDILKEGSGNPGATNVKRVLGKGPGNLVFGLDVLKGVVGTGLCHVLVKFIDVPNTAEILFRLSVAGFVGTLLGHCFSCFLKFKGGKGVASTIGGLLVLLPIPILIGAILWVTAFALTRYVSVASILLGVSLPLSCWILPLFTSFKFSPAEFWFAAAIAAFNVWTHRSNIARLLNGTENRFVKKA
ncbi:MAG: glycerol-3-phosphate 1-O-acyltransferase [Verrucomicrobia bacterium]|nr:glycerol-3-phosphate 1-O-acyltransferase [Verrucomicrobiota bacterium]NBS04118.1 glycerol-3-phosphate 1-O-acyltransferase [Verrucomicrobiota bacterium]NBY37288.1 glycerol-3-phosphate 1-O-acyltransferase [Verrucomicrobiota bacterium]